VIVLAGLVIGALLAILFRPTVPPEYTRYLVVVVIAALDVSLGGLRAWLEKSFEDRVFVASFLVNATAAALLVLIGDRLGADLVTAVAVVFGIRIFGNLTRIRKKLVGG
jgi:small basic protein